MQVSKIQQEWFNADALFQKVLKESSKYATDKNESFFYARWLIGSRIPGWLKNGLEKRPETVLARFNENQKQNEEYFMMALDIILRENGFRGLPSDFPIHKLSSLVDDYFPSAFALKTPSGEVTKKQYTMLESIAKAYTGVSRHSK